jgi:hypothetical protein
MDETMNTARIARRSSMLRIGPSGGSGGKFAFAENRPTSREPALWIPSSNTSATATWVHIFKYDLFL